LTTLDEKPKRSWAETLAAFHDRRLAGMLFLGFAAGLPRLLIFSTLSLWLREAAVDLATVTYFSWAALAYGFKFVWAPLVDRLPLPGLTTRLGRRRAWLLLAQASVITAILWIALTDPSRHLTTMAFAAVLLGFSSATQDIVIDAWRIESAPPDLQALMSSTYIAGYRIGMLAAGAGALKLASLFGAEGEYNYTAWRDSYFCMAALMVLGPLTTLLIREPVVERTENHSLRGVEDYLRFLGLFLISVAALVAVFVVSSGWFSGWKAAAGELGAFSGEALRLILAVAAGLLTARVAVAAGLARGEVVRETWVAPLADFFRRYGRPAMLLLALIGLYRISDIVMGVIAIIFYQDMGYSKDQIADITKIFGLLMTLLGGFLGGAMALRYGVMRILFWGAFLSSATNLLFVWLAGMQPNVWALAVVISADNIGGAIATTAFVAYLSGLTRVQFTAFQYALFSSLMTLFPELIGGYSGSMVNAMGYANFFLLSALIGMPVLLLVWLAARYAPHEGKSAK